MAILKCKMCGGNLEVTEGMTVCECEYCGSRQTVPTADNEKKMNLFVRANRLRFNCEFDKAAGIYESIVSEFPEEAEAYWGLLLCKYGIEYVDDPATGKKVPTCHRSSFESVMEDENLELAYEYADATAKRIYREQAKGIEELRKGIIEVSSKEEPYDIFICYKETDENGDRTLDSVLAQDIYTALIEKGYRVFFSRITLEDKLGQEYEPYIFAALHSAKVMLAVGTEYEYYDAVWVKNEWSRYLQLIAAGEKKTLIPCYKNLDAYDMPKEFARLQAQDLGKLGAIQDLIRGIGKILGVKKQSVIFETEKKSDGGNALTQRGMLELEEGEYKSALDYFERALDQDPSDAVAYLGKFLSTYGFRSLSDLKECHKVFNIDEEKDFRWAMRFAAPDLLSKLQEVKDINTVRVDRGRLIYILKKYSQKKHELELEAIRKKNQEKENNIRNTISETLARAQEELGGGSVKKAEEICSSLLEDREIAMRFRPYYAAFIDSLRCKQAVLSILQKTIEPLSVDDIRNIPPAHKYSRNDVLCSLEDLVKYGNIEKYSSLSYQRIGATEARKKRAEKQEAYDRYVNEINEKINKELEPLQKEIIDKYGAQRHALIEEMDNKIEDIKKEKEMLESQKRQYESVKANLGFFKGKEKKEYTEKIEIIDEKIARLPKEGEISTLYYSKIKEIDEKEELGIVEKSIREKYNIKTFEEFQPEHFQEYNPQLN